MLCETTLSVPQSQAMWGPGQTHNTSVFAFRVPPLARLFKISCKYKVRSPQPFKQTQRVASYQHADHLEWNFTLSVFIQIYSCVCGRPATNFETSAVSHMSEWLWGLFFFLILSDYRANWTYWVFWGSTCRRCYILGHIWFWSNKTNCIFAIFHNTLISVRE